MKKLLLAILVVAIVLPLSAKARTVLDIPTTQSFSDADVSDEDVKLILLAGSNAASAMNSQPWYFSVVTNKKVLEQINSEMMAIMQSMFKMKPPANTGAKADISDAPVAIVISCKNGSEFDAGLACENMVVAADNLGYGSKLLSSPTIVLNGPKKDEYKKIFNIPENYEVVTVLIIGKPETNETDIVSGASPRNPLSAISSYIK